MWPKGVPGDGSHQCQALCGRLSPGMLVDHEPGQAHAHYLLEGCEPSFRGANRSGASGTGATEPQGHTGGIPQALSSLDSEADGA